MRRTARRSRGRRAAARAWPCSSRGSTLLIKATDIDFRIGGSRAFYVPAHDYVQVPPPQAYFEPINWHRTALHELGHASGAPHRLNRDLSGSFGSKKYAFEELVAEMNAAFSRREPQGREVLVVPPLLPRLQRLQKLSRSKMPYTRPMSTPDAIGLPPYCV